MSDNTAAAHDVPSVVEHLFRHESGKMVATLTRIFGIEHLSLAEDVVQEALARALQTWPFYGIPDNPAAWIMRASRNLALDTVRRQKVFREKQPEIIRIMEPPGSAADQPVFSEEEIADDRLRLMFVCCHPLVAAEAQAPLVLKTLCGFNIGEISRAFLTTEPAIAKRLTRAKQKIRSAKIAFDIPAGHELTERLNGVLQSLYLLFNEGYKASIGDSLIREDLCLEAIRLVTLLVEHPMTNQPRTHALLALMLLNAARIRARVDLEGNLLLLKDQDRSQWDQQMIAAGIMHLAESATGDAISLYHLQAGIAACHCSAPNYESTDWLRILSLYDQLRGLDPSPIIALNRAVVIANVHGPEAGLRAVAAIPELETLNTYYLLYALLGDLEARLNHSQSAAVHFRKSLELAATTSEKAFLSKRLQACDAVG